MRIAFVVMLFLLLIPCSVPGLIWFPVHLFIRKESTLAEFGYNRAISQPLFGLTRVMLHFDGDLMRLLRFLLCFFLIRFEVCYVF